MGTRGLYGFRTKGEDYLTFCPMDSYPDSLGEFWFNTCKSLKEKNLTKKLSDRLSNVNNIVIEEGKYSKLLEQVSAYLGTTKQAAERFMEEYSKSLAGDEMYVFNGILEGHFNIFLNDKDFKRNGLFCEWCYIYDLDKDIFLISGSESAALYLTSEDWQKFLKMV